MTAKPNPENYLPPERSSALGRARMVAAVVVALVGACQTNEPAPVSSDSDVARIADPGEPCVQYCEARASTFMERCMLDEDNAEFCEQAWETAFDACVERQCSLTVHVPDVSGLDALATQFGHTLLGPDYEIESVVPHYYGPDEIGTRVYTMRSGEGTMAFVEVGTSVDHPPIASYGHGPTAEAALADQAIEKIGEAYGATGLSLTRRYFSAAHPILEFTADDGAAYYYSVANDDVSDVFAIEDDPDADVDALAVRRESFVREWSRHR